jgi:hypothetical protein
MDKMLQPYLDEGRKLSSLNLAHWPCCASTSSTCWTMGSLQCLLPAVFSPYNCYGNRRASRPGHRQTVCHRIPESGCLTTLIGSRVAATPPGKPSKCLGRRPRYVIAPEVWPSAMIACSGARCRKRLVAPDSRCRLNFVPRRACGRNPQNGSSSPRGAGQCLQRQPTGDGVTGLKMPDRVTRKLAPGNSNILYWLCHSADVTANYLWVTEGVFTCQLFDFTIAGEVGSSGGGLPLSALRFTQGAFNVARHTLASASILDRQRPVFKPSPPAWFELPGLRPLLYRGI